MKFKKDKVLYRECWILEGTEDELIRLEEYIYTTDIKHVIKIEGMSTNKAIEDEIVRVEAI